MNISNNKKAFTLIELMLSMFIGLVVFSGVFRTFSNQKVLYERQEKNIRINQDTRAAINIMKHYISRSGISTQQCSGEACSGIIKIENGANGAIQVTSDLDLNSVIRPTTIITDGQEENVTFIRDGNTLYICPEPTFNARTCQFILDNVSVFMIRAFDINGNEITPASTGFTAIQLSQVTSVEIQIQARGNALGDDTNAVEGSQITSRIFLINKTFRYEFK